MSTIKRVKLNKTITAALSKIKASKKSRSTYLSNMGFDAQQVASLMRQHNKTFTATGFNY